MNSKKKKMFRWKRYLPIYLIALPGLIYLFCNNYLPMFGIVIAFKDLNFSKGIFGSDWAGLDNFQFLFRSDTAWVIIRNTILYNVAFIILGTIISVAFAVFLNEIRSKFASRTYQTLILLPYLIGWVIVSYLVYAFLSADTGLFNKSILEPLGLDPVNWYSDTRYWPFIITFVYIWKSCGYSMIIYFASIVGISQDYYEAARIDGATKWQQIKNITISGYTDNRCICIQCSDAELGLWNVICGKCIPEHRRICPCYCGKPDYSEDKQRKRIILKEERSCDKD